MTNRPVKTLWFVLDSNSIGGSQSRMVKVAAKLAEETEIQTIRLLVTRELYTEYSRHKSLKQFIDHEKMEFLIYPELKVRFWDFCTRVWFYLKRRLPAGKSLTRRGDTFLLKQRSWHSFLRKNVRPGDLVHCLMGTNSRNGAFLFSRSHDNKVIIEITNNRYLQDVSNHLKQLSGVHEKRHRQCLIRSVSENVHRNFLSKFEPGWFEKRGIDTGFYSGPFMESRKKMVGIEKENVILFPHRFRKQKNCLLFSEVVCELLDEGELQGWIVLFRGEGSEEEKVRENLGPWIDRGRTEVSYSYRLFEELQKAKIVVSLIETGSYPSQSIFEAMNAGCALLLSDSGNTRSEFNHPAITFTSLKKKDVKDRLKNLCAKSDRELVSTGKEMEDYFRWFEENRSYFRDILQLYGLRESEQLASEIR